MTIQPNISFIAIALIVALSLGATAQNLDQSYLDTLGDEDLLTLFDNHNGDSIKQEKIARTYLVRGRKEKDTIKMARGYDRLARIFHTEKNIRFADSIILLTEGVKNITYPAMGYLLKGLYLTDINLTLSTINYYKAYDYALKNRNVSQQIFLLNILTIRKAYWGNKEEALELQRKNHATLRQKNIKNLLNKGTRKGQIQNFENLKTQLEFDSHLTYVICLIENNKLDSARYYFKKATTLHHRYKGYAKENQKKILLECANEINFYESNYDVSINISDRIIEASKQYSDHKSLFDAYLFKGQSLLHLNKTDEGVIFLLKADSIYNYQKVSLIPYRQELFKLLLEYYKKEGNISKQIEFYKKMTTSDSIMKKNYAFYESSFKNKIETPILLAEKEVVIDKLKKDSLAPDPKLYLTLAALMCSLCALFYFVRKRLVYKKRFEALLSGKSSIAYKTLHNGEYHNELSVTVVEDILEKLKRFERSCGYLNSEITLGRLAKTFKTNSNYLSRVINLKREKNFSQYLHELRIAYAVEELLTKASYRKYTIKAIAEECGYANAESFSRAFYKLHGIYPSYYIRKLEKNVG